MEDETKTPKLTKNVLFFISLVFFLKIQDIRKSKTPIFEKGLHENLSGQVLTISKQAQQRCYL